jgi:hypothetical protein
MRQRGRRERLDHRLLFDRPASHAREPSLIRDASTMDRPALRRRWTRRKIALLLAGAAALIACLALLVPVASRWARAERDGMIASMSVQDRDAVAKNQPLLSVVNLTQGGQVRATVVFEGESPAGLRQSERLSTRLVLERHRSVLKLPRGPFLESGGGRQAYVVEGGVAVLRTIAAGTTSVSEVEIVSGLRAGERVIVSDTSVFEGARTVLIRE